MQAQGSRLVLLSFLMLFVELTLIRLTSANFMYLAFFSNFILMASFLGIALGFLRTEKGNHLFFCAPLLLLIVVYACQQFSFEYQINMNTAIDDLSYEVKAFSIHSLPIVLTLPCLFIAVTAVMFAFASGTAKAFRTLPPLKAYRLEILGSLLGVIAFTILSLLNATPFIWGLCICLLYVVAQWQHKLIMLLQLPILCLLLAAMHIEAAAPMHFWSPYYKVALLPYSHGRYAVDVNGAPQQFIESVAQKKHYKPFYFYPYQHLAPQHALNNVLVIGAGTGGDVAVALAQGAKHVDAVEIDPQLLALGKALHPNQPYTDPRVSTYVNDGRAFLEQSKQRYDLIILALTDSMMLVTHQSSLRLENYLLTQEGFQAAREHLAADGVFSMYNYYRNSWIVDKLGNMLQSTFGRAPCLDTESEVNHWLSVFTVSANQNALRCPSQWQLQNEVLPEQATDNRPFFYMQMHELTAMYILSLVFIFITAVSSFKLAGCSFRQMRPHLDLMLMGCAFLLLETKNIINFALLFGTTWLVNSLVFFGILLTIYLATLTTERLRGHHTTVLFILLLATLLLNWLIPPHWLLNFNAALRLTLAIALAFTPIYLANLLFAARFRKSENSGDAFAANLFGAILGGLLEYSSLLIGYQNLLIVVAVIYTLAVMLSRRYQPKIMPTTKYSGAETYS